MLKIDFSFHKHRVLLQSMGSRRSYQASRMAETTRKEPRHCSWQMPDSVVDSQPPEHLPAKLLDVDDDVRHHAYSYQFSDTSSQCRFIPSSPPPLICFKPETCARFQQCLLRNKQQAKKIIMSTYYWPIQLLPHNNFLLNWNRFRSIHKCFLYSLCTYSIQRETKLYRVGEEGVHMQQ